MITKDILIEDLVKDHPASVGLLREHDLVCIICGEAVWGTLEELARAKKFSDQKIDLIIDELNQKLELK